VKDIHHFVSNCVVICHIHLSCVYLYRMLIYIMYCDVRYDFRINTMFGSYLPPLTCRRTHFLLTLFVFVYVLWCPTHIVMCFCVLFFFVLCSLRYQFLSIVLFWLLLRYSLTFIYRTYLIFDLYLQTSKYS